MKKTLFFYFAVIAILSLSHNVGATLIDRGGGLIYDSDLNITWLQESHDFDMNWFQAKDWAKNLVYHDAARNTDWTGWRLPSALNRDGSGPCYGFNCTESEFGHLYYTELGNVMGPTSVNTGPFINLGFYFYWTATEIATDPNCAWDFSFYYLDGGQFWRLKDAGSNDISLLAVRDGDVAPVPEPTILCLLGLGLATLAGMKRLKI